MNSRKTDETHKRVEEREAPYQRVADMIRKKSEAGKLVLPEEIAQALHERKGLEAGQEGLPEKELGLLVKEMMEQNEDLKEIPGHDGVPRYYSALYMSDAYARLLVRKEGDPLLLIAETIRENSRVYPRPIRRDIFKNEPFALTEEEISTCLQKMAEEDQYTDIAQTTTSEGTIFLYSTLHLEPDHASMLAEWVDVGQYRNP